MARSNGRSNGAIASDPKGERLLEVRGLEKFYPIRRGFLRKVVGHVRAGAQAEYLVVPAANLVAKPKDVTWETAGGLFLAGATALATLDDLRVGAGDTVVVSAAAGGVGSIEAQLARAAGARVIGTCGDRNFDYLRQVGIKPVRYGEGIFVG